MKFNPRGVVYGSKITSWLERPIYDGKELGQTCHRPGAYDFMKIPSMRNGERVMMGDRKPMTSELGLIKLYKDK